MPKPQPKAAGKPEVPLPAHRSTPGRHPLDPPAPEETPAEQDTEHPTPMLRDVTTSRAHDVTTPQPQGKPEASGKTRRRRTNAPAAAEAVAFTVRFDPAEAIEIDDWVMGLRRELGRGRLDKSEVVRALLTIARENQTIQRSLLRALGRS
jgi:hypothetical protein